MARVDPEDDTTRRIVVYHYRYDEDRRQRRNVEIVAFEDEEEFRAEFERLNAELAERKKDRRADPVERLFGVVKEAGHTAEQRRRREAAKNPGRAGG